jgi:iron complex outermembrane receptor protein
MRPLPAGWGVVTALGLLAGRPVTAQQTDTTLRVYPLPALTVSAGRTTLPLSRIPLSLERLDRRSISDARPTWGLDEALAAVPGVFVANRYNFSLDQRISIRGFGSRSAFAVRGITVLLDGIPQTLPDGQGQLTNLELGDADQIEVIRGSASALFGNASGGVISIWTNSLAPTHVQERLRVVGGRFGRSGRAWNKWQSTTALPVAGGSAQLTISRLDYEGERDHSAADSRNLNARVRLPLGPRWTLTGTAAVGDDPKADNPGALTAAELAANPDSAPALNLTNHAGKDVRQLQGGVTLRRALGDAGEAVVTLFGLARDLENPLPFAYVDLRRAAYGARFTIAHPVGRGRLAQQVTAGVDIQRQRDDRVNFGNSAGRPDSARSLDQLEHVMEVGPFIQSALLLSPDVTLTAGLRHDWVAFRVRDRLVGPTNPDDSGALLMGALSGSLGLTVSPGASLTLYASAGSSFETPTTTELTNRPDTAGGFNPSLAPQRAWTHEVGARGRVRDRVSWSLAVFQASVTDELISYEVPSSPERRFYRNAGSARHRGAELGATITPSTWLLAKLAYTYADFRYLHYAFSPDTAHRFVLDGRALPGVPRHWVDLRLRLQPEGSVAGGWWVELEAQHASGYLVDDTLSVRTKPWWLTMLRFGWTGQAGGMRMAPFLGVNNVLNRAYVSSVVVNASGGRYYEPAPGRNVYVGLSVEAGR